MRIKSFNLIVVVLCLMFQGCGSASQEEKVMVGQLRDNIDYLLSFDGMPPSQKKVILNVQKSVGIFGAAIATSNPQLLRARLGVDYGGNPGLKWLVLWVFDRDGGLPAIRVRNILGDEVSDITYKLEDPGKEDTVEWFAVLGVGVEWVKMSEIIGVHQDQRIVSDYTYESRSYPGALLVVREAVTLISIIDSIGRESNAMLVVEEQG